MVPGQTMLCDNLGPTYIQHQLLLVVLCTVVNFNGFKANLFFMKSKKQIHKFFMFFIHQW